MYWIFNKNITKICSGIKKANEIIQEMILNKWISDGSREDCDRNTGG